MNKKIITLFAMLFLSSVSLMAQSSESSYSKKGTLEFGGGVSFSYTKYIGRESSDVYYYDNERYTFYFRPVLNYYFFDSFHAGIVPVFLAGISKNDINTSKDFSIGPEISIGYTFTINPGLFFDISPSYTYYGYKSYNDHYEDSDFDYYSEYGLKLSLKFIINNNTLVNVYLSQSYSDYSSNYTLDREYSISLGAGITSFVNF